MNDRELLEMAAKAVGINRRYYGLHITGESGMINDDPDGGFWNPLTDDGDALRLAVRLRIDIEMYSDEVFCFRSRGIERSNAVEAWVDFNGDPDAATRRAIVKAAAVIGKGMKQ